MDSRTKRTILEAITILGLALINSHTEITIHRLPYQYGLLQDGQCGIIEAPRQPVTECLPRSQEPQPTQD